MKQSYLATPVFATFFQTFAEKRLLAFLDFTTTTIWLAALQIAKGFAIKFSRLRDYFTLKGLKAVKAVSLSMDWMAKGVGWGSAWMFSSIRNMLEEWGLLVVERQSKGLGKNQPITRLLKIDFDGLMMVSRAVVIEFNRRARIAGKGSPDWGSLLPGHGFKYADQLFCKACRYSLFAPGEGYGETIEEIEDFNDAEEAAWDETEAERTNAQEALLAEAEEWYEESFGEPLPDETFASSEDPQRTNWNTHRMSVFKSDLAAGLCRDWNEFALKDTERIVIEEGVDGWEQFAI